MSTVLNSKIVGNALYFDIAGTPYWADVASVAFEPESGDPATFGEAAAGLGGGWKLKFTAIMSTATGSLWSYIWTNAGKEVAVVMAPHGNKTASAEQPHVKATVKIGAKPPIGTEVNKNEGMTFEAEWKVIGEPELKRTA